MMPSPVLSEEFLQKWNEMCVSETPESVTSISTSRYVPQPIENRPHYVCNRLFVGGFPPGTTSKQLSSLFSSYGTVISCNVLSQDPLKNYGFVTFEDTTSAEAVLNGALLKTAAFQIGGYALKIKRAVFKPKKATSNDEMQKQYRGKHDIVKFYGRSAEVKIIRENIRSYSNLGTILIPIIQNPHPLRAAEPFPILPQVLNGVALPNYNMQPSMDNDRPQPLMVTSGPVCYRPPSSACFGGPPRQWQSPMFDFQYVNR